MRHRMIPAIAVITLAVLLNGPVLAQEEPKDQLDVEIKKLTIYLQNSLVKVKHGTSSVGTAVRGPVAQERNARLSPAGECCEANIIAISDATASLRAMLKSLRYQFREDEKRAGVASVRAMGFHLDDMEARVRQFAGTGEKEFAVKFLELAIVAVNSLRDEKLDLEACCGDRLKNLPVQGKKQEAGADNSQS